MLPNVLPPLIVQSTLAIAAAVIAEASLSFLGLGIQPPTPAWGNMLGEGRVYMLTSWWIAAFPGLAIFVTALAAAVIVLALGVILEGTGFAEGLRKVLRYYT